VSSTTRKCLSPTTPNSPYDEIIIKEIYCMKNCKHLNKSRKILFASFIGLFVFMLFGCGSAPSSSASTTTTTTAVGMDLDAAIKDASTQMETRIPSGTMIALVSVASPSTAFSTQVLTRLESAIVSSGKLVVVDRANLDKVRAEQGFQLSGEVDDESAKSIGKLLGAGAIVTGSLTDLGDVYSLTLKAINIETATVAVSYLADLAKTTRIETLLATRDGAVTTATPRQTSPGGTTTPAAQAPVPPPAPAAPPAPTYKVGDTGPAGGVIFYDKGNNSGGWRYLEAAPAHTEFKAAWGARGTRVGQTGIPVGTGKTNTQRILPFLDQLGENNRAARLCVMLNINGFNDWFLPSKAELDWIYINLRRNGLGGFSNDWYWSSSEWPGQESSYAHVQNFGDGREGNMETEKNRTHSVRAVRQF
jgi:hypothetical protein